MIKIISLFKRKTDLSVEAFQEYWRNEHAEIVCRMPGVRRYVQSHTLLSGYKNRTPAVDGVAELWFDDTQALRKLAKTDALQATQADHASFMDLSSYVEMVTEDVVVKDGQIPADGVKNIELVRKKTSMEAAAFHQYWIETHGPLGASIPQVQRYVQSHTRNSAYRDGGQPDLDGVALTWFEDTQAMRAAAKTSEYERTRADEQNFLSIPLDFVITTENVVIA